MKKILLSALLITASMVITNAQSLTTPYSDDFETGSALWTTQNSGSDWQLGMPGYGITNSTHSGSNCWDINLDTSYANNTSSKLISPAFNFNGNTGIKISFWMNMKCEAFWDGLALYVGTDSTFTNWSQVGSVNDPYSINWYNTSSINANGLPGWSGTTQAWQYCSIVIPNTFGNSDVWFAFEFVSDASVASDGVSIDDFSIEESNVGFMEGTVYEDVNNNGIIDVADVPFTAISLSCNPALGTYIQTVDANGHYSFIGDSGSTYTITPNNPIYTSISPASQTATITATGQVISNLDFLLTIIPGVIEMNITASGWNVRPGFNHHQYVHYSNNGTQITSGSVQVDYDPSFTLISCSEPYTVTGPNQIEVSYSNLIPGQSGYFNCTYFVDSTLALGTLTHSNFTVLPVIGDTIPTNNYDELCIAATNSFDPNDKRVDPVGDITPAQVATGIPLDYTINFQNTGTAEAYHINVYDQLDTDLDLTTFEITGTSHPLTSWSMSANGLLHFTFANINLPDSNANEPASHGFINYRIKPLSTLTVGAEITNIAAIVFDNNEPVITNEVKTRVLIPTGLNQPGDEIGGILFPNPSNGQFYFSGNKGLGSYKSYSILNAEGQLIEKAPLKGSQGVLHLDLQHLSAGTYFLSVEGANGRYVSKFIVQ